ncbi:O-antigen ligase family protein [Thioalkalivibrio sp. ALgr1]|uniref:O-antigen ligase family protein n=1 Tax=Thioalkalivibrio sp. ALgr1 TaxID=748655 RepID=UPI001E5BE705|nr:O-antigen ligase family protein [Thioalkalivibrio sp. ALgr1]
MVDVLVREITSPALGAAVVYQAGTAAMVVMIGDQLRRGWLWAFPAVGLVIGGYYIGVGWFGWDLREHWLYGGATNQAALWVALAVVMSVWLLLPSMRPTTKSYGDPMFSLARSGLLLLVLAILLLAVLLSGSRQALLLSVVTSLVMLYMGASWRWLSLGLLALVALLIATIQGVPQLERLGNVFDLVRTGIPRGEGSIPHRLALLEYGAVAWLESPIIGQGARSFQYLSGFGGYSHNNYVEVLYSFGVMGFVLFYLPLLLALWLVWIKRGCEDGKNWRILIVSLAVFWFGQDWFIVSYFRYSHWAMIAVMFYASAVLVAGCRSQKALLPRRF